MRQACTVGCRVPTAARNCACQCRPAALAHSLLLLRRTVLHCVAPHAEARCACCVLSLLQVNRSLAAEREAKKAAEKDRALVQIVLDAKQRLADAMREVRASRERAVAAFLQRGLLHICVGNAWLDASCCALLLLLGHSCAPLSNCPVPWLFMWLLAAGGSGGGQGACG